MAHKKHSKRWSNRDFEILYSRFLFLLNSAYKFGQVYFLAQLTKRQNLLFEITKISNKGLIHFCNLFM